jgi:hypothetical protein
MRHSELCDMRHSELCDRILPSPPPSEITAELDYIVMKRTEYFVSL